MRPAHMYGPRSCRAGYSQVLAPTQVRSCHFFAGCFIAPLTFQLYWHSFNIGDPHSEYKAPFANIYRGMAVIGTQVSSTYLYMLPNR